MGVECEWVVRVVLGGRGEVSSNCLLKTCGKGCMVCGW